MRTSGKSRRTTSGSSATALVATPRPCAAASTKKARSSRSADGTDAGDYYVRNTQTTLRQYAVTPSAEVFGSLQVSRQVELSRTTVSKWLAFVQSTDRNAVDDLPEAPVMARWGGQAVVVPYLDGRSTTRLVQEVVARGR